MQRSNPTTRSVALIAVVAAIGIGLALWKWTTLRASAGAAQPELAEVVEATTARAHEYRPTTTSIGTVVALRSIALRNEVAGTVHTAALQPGAVVEAGTVLVTLDTSVEQAELAAQRAEAKLAGTRLARARQLVTHGGMSVEELDNADAQYRVIAAQIERTQAVIARKTLRAPFRARVGIADVHPGQYLDQGTLLTTLQGIDDAVYVDFVVAQQVAAGLRTGDSVDIEGAGAARIVAIDARVDAKTRNTTVRARIDAARAIAPGASLRVRAAAAAAHNGVAVPTSALRRSPEGDHVFILAQAADGRLRAKLRRVQAGIVLGDEVLLERGLQAGERVATSGSFKLRDDALVQLAAADANAATAATAN